MAAISFCVMQPRLKDQRSRDSSRRSFQRENKASKDTKENCPWEEGREGGGVGGKRKEFYKRWLKYRGN